MEPFVGETVHYVAYGTPGGEFPAGVCRAAIVTEVLSGNPDWAASGGAAEGGGGLDQALTIVGLCVLNPTGQFFNRDVPYMPYSKDRKPGSWHYVTDHR